MSQTDVSGTQFLNTPPILPPFPGDSSDRPSMPSPPGVPGPMDTGAVAGLIGKATATDPPTMIDASDVEVELPAGWITPEGLLVSTARVRELNGYDEERLARVDMQKNVAKYVTELLELGVEDLGGQKPTKEVLQGLLIGDRDALILGIRRATYGNEVEFKLSCSVCGNDSEVNVELDIDVKITKLDDPLVRVFDVPLRREKSAKVVLLNGVTQEAFSDGIGKKTQAEVNTIMLSKSVVEIDGVPTLGKENAARALSAADRDTIMTFIAEHQPGPQLKDIQVACATCGEEYPVSLGLPNLFRF